MGEKFSGFAITSLVLGILSYLINILYLFIVPIIVPILSIVFGILALRDIKKDNKKGKGLAITGIVISVIVLLILLAIVILGLGGAFDIWS